jgi:hypothetical protein
VFLLLRDLLAHAINLPQLRNICLEELDLSILVQFLALLDDAIRCGFAAADDVDARGKGILNKGFGSVFSNS